MYNTLRNRIAISFILIILIGMVILAVSITTISRNNFLTIYQEKLIQESELLAELLAERMSTAEPSVQMDQIARQYSDSLDTRVTLIGKDGTVLGESDADRLTMTNHYTHPEIQEAFLNGFGSDTRYSRTIGQEMIYAATRVEWDAEVVGVVRVAIPYETFQSYLAQMTRLITGLTAILVFIFILISIIISENNARPIQKIVEKVEAMDAGNFSYTIAHTRSKELQTLNQALNNMGEKFTTAIAMINSEKNRLSIVLEQMADGALIVDHLGKVEYINPTALQLLDTNQKETLGHTVAEVVRHHQIIDLWRKCQDTNEQQGALVETSGEKGRFLQVIITPFVELEHRGYLLILQDLTAIRRLETIRRDFISNISHDLRTPISSMRLMTETLQDGAINDPEASVRFLELMEESIETMSQLVEELLELSHTQSGDVPMQIKPVPLSSLLEPALERLSPQAERANLTLLYRVPRFMPMVMADAERINAVVTNLLHNAIKFTPPGGTVTISALEKEDHIVVSITDTGIGIPEEDARQIFERFFKVDRARSTKGMGLGLSIAKSVVEEHGGRIWVESKEGEGSTFSFSLPILPVS
ncbi:MAG: ATP-binding protein [Anaerolineae bacterium]|jgi:two-component system phosphate regulon sensor histidine kinase PhoR|nr:ATP-binding protein [Anaerolineae bacterium]